MKFPCPVCAAATARLFEKDGYGIRGCAGCGHRFAELSAGPEHAARVYADDYFNGGGAGYSDYLAEADLLRAHGRRYGALLKRYAAPASLLDVGAAAGFIAQGLQDEGWLVSGIEPNAGMAEHARAKVGLPVQTGTLEDLPDGAQYAVATMIQVVPHFYDLRRAFAAAARVTEPGGHWLIETWNRGSWTAWLFGQNWHEYSPPSVLHWFTPESLQKLAANCGMQPVAQGRPVKLLPGAHAKSLLSHKLGDGTLGRVARLPLALVPDKLPLPYPAEDLFWALFRKN